ncbi:MAG: amidohydrolase family protein [Acidobacteria bacterium]|nr:amidohydrolase family protein [Acidobacteriota bacterium]
MQKLTKIFIVIFFCLFITTNYTYAERPRIYALTNAKIVVAPGKVINKGTIILRDGLIEAVGENLSIPADAVEIDSTGKTIYPGLIDISATLTSSARRTTRPETTPNNPIQQFLQGQQTEPQTGAIHPIARVRPENHTSEQLSQFSQDNKDIENFRNLGITTILVVPTNGIFRGESVLINLRNSTPVPDLILKDSVAQHVAFEFGFFGGTYPSSLFGATAAFRQVLLDASRYQTWQERYKNNSTGMKRPEYSAAYEALTPVLKGSRPVIFELNNNQDILLADRLAQEFNLNAVIFNNGNEWEYIDEIKTLKRTFILSTAFPEKPKLENEDETINVSLKDLKRYVNAPENAKRFYDAGLRFAFTTRYLRNKTDLNKNIRKMLEAGLPLDTVIAAFTTIPAEIIGVSNNLGTLEKGKIANLFVTSGELFAEKTKVERVFVDGYDYQMEDKKPMLGDTPEPKENE